MKMQIKLTQTFEDNINNSTPKKVNYSNIQTEAAFLNSKICLWYSLIMENGMAGTMKKLETKM
jgi:hypothetical protein